MTRPKWPHHFLLTISHLIEEKEKITSQSDTFGSLDYRLIQFRSRLFTFPPFFLPSFLSPQSRANQLSLKEDRSTSSFFPPSANQETNYYSKETLFLAGPLLPLLPPLRSVPPTNWYFNESQVFPLVAEFQRTRGKSKQARFKRRRRATLVGQATLKQQRLRRFVKSDASGPRSLPDMVSIVASLLSTPPPVSALSFFFFFSSLRCSGAVTTHEKTAVGPSPPARGARKRAAKKSGSSSHSNSNCSIGRGPSARWGIGGFFLFFLRSFMNNVWRYLLRFIYWIFFRGNNLVWLIFVETWIWENMKRLISSFNCSKRRCGL